MSSNFQALRRQLARNLRPIYEARLRQDDANQIILRQAGKIIKMKKEMAKMKKKMEEFKSVAVSLYELQLIRDEIHRRRLASLHRSPLPNTYLV